MTRQHGKSNSADGSAGARRGSRASSRPRGRQRQRRWSTLLCAAVTLGLLGGVGYWACSHLVAVRVQAGSASEAQAGNRTTDHPPDASDQPPSQPGQREQSSGEQPPCEAPTAGAGNEKQAGQPGSQALSLKTREKTRELLSIETVAHRPWRAWPQAAVDSASSGTHSSADAGGEAEPDQPAPRAGAASGTAPGGHPGAESVEFFGMEVTPEPKNVPPTQDDKNGSGSG